ncbi:tRNA (carboxymethyluridine(34)-5-O)-methyltransferase [Aegilops tauschii subsp. strangulata]|uniref:Methyltransferase type 11 domain-containing protein n=1 Tax=Aegilops tauschii subsp. strangulata TaxID=200361 RepID=A0A453PJ90_AEGTS|nr:tRNA (carboxymethyluridine(34)-5-O)-methyltransferase [Aegilops tauschii subsp. strangulata]
MIQIFSRIAARSPRRATSASHPSSSKHRPGQFPCCSPAYRGITAISTSNPMRSGDGNSEGQDAPLAEGKDHGCSPGVQSTPDIEKKYVHRVYDAIAPHFSSTRFAKWPKVAGFLNSLRPGSVVLDAGCGNGKYLGFNPECFYIGCDISPPLIEICAGRGHEVFVADAVNLPYRENVADAAISIAVLHHLSTEDRRRKAIEELIRVVKRGGLVLITVWAVEQEDKSLLNKWTPLCDKYNEEWVDPSSPMVRNKSATTLDSIEETDEDTRAVKQTDDQLKNSYDGLEDKTLIMDEHDKTQQEYFVPWHLPFHRAEIGGASAAALQNGLAKKDDKKGTVVYNRYYHIFVEGELQRLVAGMKNAAIVDQFYDKSNWCIVLEKL